MARWSATFNPTLLFLFSFLSGHLGPPHLYLAPLLDSRTQGITDVCRKESGKDIKHTYLVFLALSSSKKKRGSKKWILRINWYVWLTEHQVLLSIKHTCTLKTNLQHNTGRISWHAVKTSKWKQTRSSSTYCVSGQPFLTLRYIRLPCGPFYKFPSITLNRKDALEGGGRHFCSGCGCDSHVQARWRPLTVPTEIVEPLSILTPSRNCLKNNCNKSD